MPFIYRVNFGPENTDEITDVVIVTMPTMNAGLALQEAQSVTLDDGVVKGVDLIDAIPDLEDLES